MKAKLTGAIAAGLLMSAAAFGQTFTSYRPIPQSSVPVAVREAFKSAYPKASARGYEKVEVNGVPFYRVESVDASIQRKILYSTDGKVSKIRERIVAADLPPGAKQVMSWEYSKAKITSVEKIIEADQVTYEVSVKQGGKMFDLHFDGEGQLTAAREVKIYIR